MITMVSKFIGVVLALILWLSSPLSVLGASSSSINRADNRGEYTGKDFSNQVLTEMEFTNANLENSNFSYSDLRGVVFNGSSMIQANLHGANFTNGIAYLVDFSQADLSDAILTEAILIRSSFNGADITGADFSEAVLDRAQIVKLCTKATGINSKTGVSTRESLGCR